MVNTPWKESDLAAESSPMSLDEARQEVTASTVDIMEGFMRRQAAMNNIAQSKINELGPSLSYSDLSVIRFDREAELLQKFEKEALEKWEDPKLVKMLIWYLMYAGKSKQLGILGKDSVFGKEFVSEQELLSNLSELTALVADTYDAYWERPWGTRLVRQIETDFIRDIASGIENKRMAIDLWTADGHIARQIQALGFEKTIGFEQCPEMLRVAKGKSEGADLDFQQANLFEWIPLDKASVDLVVANFWSASEVSKDIIPEVDRVLRSGGKAVLSFYNSNSITQSWWQPLQNAIEPILNPKSGFIEVPFYGEDGSAKVFKIFAKPYSLDEIASRVTQTDLQLEKAWSFSPTLTLTPQTFFDGKDRRKQLERYEKEHYCVWPYVWFYITVVLSKA